MGEEIKEVFLKDCLENLKNSFSNKLTYQDKFLLCGLDRIM